MEGGYGEGRGDGITGNKVQKDNDGDRKWKAEREVLRGSEKGGKTAPQTGGREMKRQRQGTEMGQGQGTKTAEHRGEKDRK